MADVLADEVVAGGHNHVPLTAVAHALQDLAHAHRHRGLNAKQIVRASEGGRETMSVISFLLIQNKFYGGVQASHVK